MAAVSKREDHVAAHHKVGWFMDSIRKYVFDFSVKFSTKGDKGFPQLHRIVQEELKDESSLKVCNDKQKSDAKSISENEITEMEKLHNEMNATKFKNGTSTEKLEPILSNKSPPEHVKDKSLLNPTSKRIMIRSRL